jgi:penicillin-binding protein 1A
VTNAAFVLMTGDGRILAEVGGVNFKKNQFNVVTQGRRQPGSSFKPFVYATAFALGKLNVDSAVSNDRLVYTDPSTGNTWSPRNDNGKYGGMVSVRSAVAGSINTPAVRTLLDVGIPTVVSYCHDVFGFTSEMPEYPTLALGACSVAPLEMAQAYAVFADRGSRPTPFLISKVTSADGASPDAVTEEENGPQMARNVLDSGVCDDVNVLLRAVVTGGTGTAASDVPDARGKTGTTSDNKDAWFCGSANGLIGVGWVGNDVYSKKRKRWESLPMSRSVFGGTVTVDMWADVERAAFKKFGTKFQLTDGQNAEADSSARKIKADEDKGDPAIPLDPANPVDPANPNPNGSPNQTNPPLAGDPGATHGQDPQTSNNPPPPPPDPTLAEPRPTTPPVPPSQAPSRPRNTARAPRTKDVEYVDVEICADTGELATDYCPETVTRRYVKGHEPKKRCHLHRG